MSSVAREPIAIVGIGCRLPGGVDDPRSLWQLMADGVDAITTIPPTRFDAEHFYDERPATAGRIMSRFGGFVDGIEGIDTGFFQMSPREAERLDPQQRLLLETSWEALEDAGLPRDRIAGTSAGVYVGMWLNEYESRLFADTDQIDFYMTTGTGRYAASGRLSYFLDVLGPSVTVDSACSSSLVAVHLACRGLQMGECDIALAGGANVIVEPFITIAYSQSRLMTPDGRCKFGDASANGFVRSDGAVMLALKRLADAQAAGDHVYAVIRGSSVTNDGRSSGFLATPGQAGQEEMLRKAYADAGIDPATVQYIEAHGTGTAAGDPVEIGAIGAVVGAVPGRTEALVIGSLKTNIGHCEGAAGAAGLAKLALALERAEVPASLHVRKRNPAIPWDDLQVRVATTAEPWPAADGPRRGGVSAFGITGTNAHVVVEEAPVAADAARRGAVRPPAAAYVLPVSASGAPALRALGARYVESVRQADDLGELCAAAATQRSHLGDRIAVVGADAEEIATALEQRLSISTDAHRSLDPVRVVFVFPGQGSQWPGMARQLLAEHAVFAEALTECDAAVRAEAGWSPIEVLTTEGAADRLDDIGVVQPLLFTVQVALARLWASWGVTPDAVVGHSMGEVAAAHVAGALDLRDAVAVICRRSDLLRRIAGQGAMALVELDVDAADAALAAHRSTLSVAVSNGPRSTVLSGDPAALAEVLRDLETADVFARPVKVDVASHSPQVDPLLEELRDALASITPRPPVVPMRSTVHGTDVEGAVLDAGYWADNLRQPVMFGAAVDALAATGPTRFVELGPHPILVPSVEQVLAGGGHAGGVVASMRRAAPETATMFAGLASLYEAGATIDWAAVSGRPQTRVVLPSYPWQRQPFWYQPATASATRVGGHPVLGHAVRPAAEPGLVHWQTTLTGRDLDFLRDHVVQGSPILPATGIVELARAAVWDGAAGPAVITDLELREALPVDEEHPRLVQITIDRTTTPARGQVWSCEAQDGAEWQLHAQLRIARGGEPRLVAVDEVRARCTVHREGSAHDAAMAQRHLAYGATFRLVRELWVGDGEAIGRIDTEGLRGGSAQLAVTALDSCWQVAISALENSGRTFVPVGADRVVVDALDGAAWAHAAITAADRDHVWCDIVALDAAGRVLASVEQLRLQAVGDGGRHHLDRLLFDWQWRPSPRAEAPVRAPGRWVVYSADELGDGIVARLRAAGNTCLVVRPAGSALAAGERSPASDAADAHLALLAEAAGPGALAGVAYAWAAALHGAPTDLDGVERVGSLAPTAVLQAVSMLDGASPRVYLVTDGAHADDPVQALVWGLGRVAANELPGTACTLIDAGGGGAADPSAEILAGVGDDQVAFVDGARCVGRLVPAAGGTRSAARTRGTDRFRLAATTPGALDGLRPVAMARRAPGADEVEIRIDAAALNFLDVLKAMGICPGFEPSPDVALGGECAGVVTAVGAGVSGLAAGDAVMAITPSYRTTPLLASHATLPAGLVQRRPAGLTAEEAAGAPVAYLTAYYTLCVVGRLRAGDRVLVHAATGGVGLAALEVCRMVGADVIATAGSARKRDHLRALGIAHVFDSRSTDFGREVLEVTGGEGVDVVLNSLTGEAIPVGLSVLRRGGRFLEIGKRDVYGGTRIDLSPFRNNLTMSVVDLAAITEEDPGYMSDLFAEVVAMLADGRLPPLPVTATPLADATEAFREMAQAAHIGKLVLTVDHEHPVAVDRPAVDPDATYLVTGGTRGVGLAVAERLVALGARHLALLARSEPAPASLATIEALRQMDADVRVLAADVADEAQVRAAIATIDAEMAPLGGVFHAAGVLADATIASMDTARVRAALAPKLRGGWHLHRATADRPLDHFVMFSSVAGVLGATGQSNYAAGNTFLDALAVHRRRIGRAATSIQWGPWAEIGLAAQAANRGDRLADRGLASLSPADGLAAFERLLGDDRASVAVMELDAAAWIDAQPQAAALLTDLVTERSPAAISGETLHAVVTAAAAGVLRRRAMEDGVAAELAPVLRVAPERIDRHQPLKAMGLDSLMALELRNRLERATGLTLPATIAWNFPTVVVLAEHLAVLMGIDLDAAIAPEPGPPAVAPADDQPTPELSQDELARQLLAELDAVDRLLDTESP